MNLYHVKKSGHIIKPMENFLYAKMRNYMRLISLILSLFYSVYAWCNEQKAAQEILGFKEGEYHLVSGDLPCAQGYVGWMTGYESLSFKVGSWIAITRINEGLLKKPPEPGACAEDSTATLTTNTIEQVDNTNCPEGKFKRRDLVTIKDESVKYSSVSYKDGKVIKEINCIYTRSSDKKN